MRQDHFCMHESNKRESACLPDVFRFWMNPMYRLAKTDWRWWTGEKLSRNRVWVPWGRSQIIFVAVFQALFLRVQLPETRSIKCSGIYTEKLDYKLWIHVTKLLQYLMHLVKHYCSLAWQISLRLRGEESQVQLGGKVIPQMLCCSHPRQEVTIQFYLCNFITGSTSREEQTLCFTFSRCWIRAK